VGHQAIVSPSQDWGHATLDLRGARLIIGSYSRTTAGFYIANDWVETLQGDAAAESVGEAIIRALAQSEADVPVPDWRTSTVGRSKLDAAGVRGWPTFHKGLREVNVRRDEAGYLLTPMHNKGGQGPERGLYDSPTSRADFHPTSPPRCSGPRLWRSRTSRSHGLPSSRVGRGGPRHRFDVAELHDRLRQLIQASDDDRIGDHTMARSRCTLLATSRALGPP
jgi:hypothetical protein